MHNFLMRLLEEIKHSNQSIINRYYSTEQKYPILILLSLCIVYVIKNLISLFICGYPALRLKV